MAVERRREHDRLATFACEVRDRRLSAGFTYRHGFPASQGTRPHIDVDGRDVGVRGAVIRLVGEGVGSVVQSICRVGERTVVIQRERTVRHGPDTRLAVSAECTVSASVSLPSTPSVALIVRPTAETASYESLTAAGGSFTAPTVIETVTVVESRLPSFAL